MSAGSVSWNEALRVSGLKSDVAIVRASAKHGLRGARKAEWLVRAAMSVGELYRWPISWVESDMAADADEDGADDG
jgi:hypothetical protein